MRQLTVDALSHGQQDLPAHEGGREGAEYE